MDPDIAPDVSGGEQRRALTTLTVVGGQNDRQPIDIAALSGVSGGKVGTKSGCTERTR
jgi:hypothetical protein